jgi:hypothetical protein
MDVVSRTKAKLFHVAVVVTVISTTALLAVPEPSASATTAGQEGLTWLAAGDSYASGQGLPVSTAPCAQGTGQNGSGATWAVSAAGILKTAGVTIAHGSPDLVACTGAISDEFFHSHTGLVDDLPANLKTPHGPQWRPQMGRYDLVSFSFGGNDIGFVSILLHCRTIGCPSDASVRQKITELGTTGVYKGSLQIPPYPVFLDTVAKQAVVPGGNVIVMGYPEVFDTPGLWGATAQTECAGYSKATVQLFRGWAGDLNATIGKAVAKVNAEPASTRNGVHFTFIDPVSGGGAISRSDPNLFEPATGTRHEL